MAVEGAAVGSSAGSVLVRAAVLADVPGIAEVHVESWHTTYAGIFPADVIESFSAERRAEEWTAALSDPPPRSALRVAESDGRIVGFACTGPFRGGKVASTDGELYAIYLRRSTQRQGIGRRLFEASAETLREAGFAAMRCWVIEGNPAIRFYERVGGVRVASQPFEAGGQTLIEHGYRFDLHNARS